MTLSTNTAQRVKTDLAVYVADHARATGSLPDSRAVEDLANEATRRADHNETIEAALANPTPAPSFTHNGGRIDLPTGLEIVPGGEYARVTLRDGKIEAVEVLDATLRPVMSPGSRAMRQRRQRFAELRKNPEWRARIESVALGNDNPDVKEAKCERIYQESIRAFGEPVVAMKRGRR